MKVSLQASIQQASAKATTTVPDPHRHVWYHCRVRPRHFRPDRK